MITYCDFKEIPSYGVNNLSSATVDAPSNFWGHSSGPYHETLNPNGQGCQVSDNVNFDPWGMIPYNSIQGGEFDFVSDAEPFAMPVFYRGSRSFFYFYVDETGSTPPEGTTFDFIMNSGNTAVNAGGEYLGSGILKLWVDLSDGFEPSELQVTIPNVISDGGTDYVFNNPPAQFSIPLEDRPISQSIDVFAGGSAGVKLIAGGVAAGPSIAAASLSLNCTGGMGFNFTRDVLGNELISRRFEAGIGLSLETPAINAVVGDVQAGLSASVMVKGMLGQSMQFPHDLDNDLVKESKGCLCSGKFFTGWD